MAIPPPAPLASIEAQTCNDEAVEDLPVILYELSLPCELG
jgi:hypothetical protein